jgi:Leucine-rich repeat (LRR) protein
VVTGITSGTSPPILVTIFGWLSVVTVFIFALRYGVKCTGPDIYALVLKDNNLIGTIPDAIRQLSRVQFLYLSSNSLQGTIPTAIGALNQLQQLGKLYVHLLSPAGFDLNSLSGAIPTTFANLHALQNLFLQDNKLTGIVKPLDCTCNNQSWS